MARRRFRSGRCRDRLFGAGFAVDPIDAGINHLDIRHQIALLALIRRLPATAVMALHDLNHACVYCDRVLLLRQGRAVALGPPAEVLTPATIRAVFGVEVAVHTDPEDGVRSLLVKSHVSFEGTLP